MSKIQPVVVIYNTRCSDSESVTALLAQDRKPIVIDNSIEDYGNEAFCQDNGLPYHSMGYNAGLSKAYNAALDLLEGDYVLWMDDDTELPEKYFTQMEAYLDKYPDYDVYLPVVITETNGILSPSLLHRYNTSRISSLTELKGHMFSAINSGMLVRKTVYDHYRYDENLFLDCIDHDFMVHCRKERLKIRLMKGIVLTQNFSGDQKADKKSLLNRYRIFSKDFRYFRKKNRCPGISTSMILMKRFLHILIS